MDDFCTGQGSKLKSTKTYIKNNLETELFYGLLINTVNPNDRAIQ